MAEDWKEQYDYYFNKVNNANVESAKKQMDFQERMSSTAHQREVKDLIAAGLNPVLSANNGASSPMGAYANVDSSPISAKFARQNLNKELENARLIQSMQNDNAMAIAMQQIGAQLQIQKYATDENNRTSRFNTIVQEYGPLAGLVYGMTEGMYDGLPGVNGAINSMSDTNSMLQGLIDSAGNTSKVAQAAQDLAEKFLAGHYDSNTTKYFYGDNTLLDLTGDNSSSKSGNKSSGNSKQFGTSYNTNSDFANSVEKMKQKFVDYIKKTSPNDGKKPKQYNNYHNKHNKATVRKF